jgi:hypothetical protein
VAEVYIQYRVIFLLKDPNACLHTQLDLKAQINHLGTLLCSTVFHSPWCKLARSGHSCHATSALQGLQHCVPTRFKWYTRMALDARHSMKHTGFGWPGLKSPDQ